jgi:hypothetical protein
MLTLLHNLNDFTLMVLQGYGLHATITGRYTMLLLGVPLTWILLSIPPCLNIIQRATITVDYTQCAITISWIFRLRPYQGYYVRATITGY